MQKSKNRDPFAKTQKNKGFFRKPKKADNDNDNVNDNEDVYDNVDENDTDTVNENDAAKAARKNHKGVKNRKQVGNIKPAGAGVCVFKKIRIWDFCFTVAF